MDIESKVIAMGRHDARKRLLVQRLAIGSDDFFERRFQRQGKSTVYEMETVVLKSGEEAKVSVFPLDYDVRICQDSTKRAGFLVDGMGVDNRLLSASRLVTLMHARIGSRGIFGLRCAVCKDLNDIAVIISQS